MNKVSFLNLTKLHDGMKAELREAMDRVIDRAAFISGEELKEFEKNFAQWVGPDNFVVGCGNGTDALTLAAKALDLPAGSEAIIPAMTFVATAEALSHAGLKLKLVDVVPGTWLMDLDQLEKAITTNTKLIVPVHLYGQMPDMERVRKIADKHHCKVLEDSAQGHGATWANRPVGTFGDIATYSFFPGKNLGAFGDGGGVLTRNAALAQVVRNLANHGGPKKYQHDIVGFNSRLDNLQASILTAKLKHLTKWNEKRQQLARFYEESLGQVKGLSLPKADPMAGHVYHLYVVTTENREALAEHLHSKGVPTGVHYPKAIHQQPAFSSFPFAQEKYPNSEYVAAHGLSLPMCPTLTPEEAEYVATSVKSFFN